MAWCTIHTRGVLKRYRRGRTHSALEPMKTSWESSIYNEWGTGRLGASQAAKSEGWKGQDECRQMEGNGTGG